MTKYYRLGGLKDMHLFFHSSGHLKSGIKVSARLVPFENHEGSSLGLSLMFVDGHLLPMPSHIFPSVHDYFHISSSYENISHIELGPTVMT